MSVSFLSLAKDHEQSIQGQEPVVRETFFESRLDLDEELRLDFSRLSRCQPTGTAPLSKLSTESGAKPTKSVEQKANQRRILFRSAPEIGSQRSHLKGNVTIQDANTVIKAEDVVLDHQAQQLKATGGVSIESKGAIFGADSLHKDDKEQTVTMENAQFYLFSNNGNGKAKTVSIDEQNQTRLDELTFTTCPADDETWLLASSEMNLDQSSGRGEAWNTTIRVKGVPVFYFPYINFPIDDRRQSGLLSPTLRNTDKSGFDLSLPIYWNIAPNMDATFIPREMNKRGFQLGSEFRWLTQKTYSEFYGEWMDKDKLVDSALENPGAGRITAANSSQRWMAKLNHKAVFSDAWQLELNTHRVSDTDYFRDFSSGLESSNETQLSSNASLNYQDYIWDVGLFAVTHQALIGTESYRLLPSLNAKADYLSERGFRWQLDSQWSRFEHKDINLVEGTRTNIMPSLSYPVNANWGFVIPKLSYQSTRYHQESQVNGETQSISRNLPIFSLDSGLYFDRDSLWFGEDYTHTLSPRFFYSYIPHKNQSQISLFDTTLPSFEFNQLWRENRFSGIDRVGDTNHISIALANTLVRNQSGEQVFDFRLGRRYYLDDRLIQLNDEFEDDRTASPWLAELSFKLSDTTEYEGFIEWDKGTRSTNQARNRIKFEPITNHIVNLSHRYRDIGGQVSEEIDFSFAWPINDSWRLVGRWYNDLRRDQTIESMAGIEYESCCWAIRLVAQKYLNTQLNRFGVPVTLGVDEYSDGIFFQFVFKGLGSAGQSGLNSLLESSIAGYQDPFARTQ